MWIIRLNCIYSNTFYHTNVFMLKKAYKRVNVSQVLPAMWKQVNFLLPFIDNMKVHFQKPKFNGLLL